MNSNDSMGFVETIGLASAIKVSDIMVKSANVHIETVANADAGLITVICMGDLASCNAAVDAARASLSGTGQYFNTNQIPRPSSDVQLLVSDYIKNMIKLKKAEKPKAAARKPGKTKK